MNVLIFVTTILMLLSIMTYARLESYRNSQAFQIVFKHYMQDKERGFINGKADDVYKSIIVHEKEEEKPGEDKAKKNPRADGSPRIAIGLLFEKNRDSKKDDWDQTRILLKKLIINLYENQPFYQKVAAGRPMIVDDLIAAITQAIDQIPDDKALKKTGDLANLKLADPVLDSLLYKILHGAFYMNAHIDGQNLVLPEVSTDNISDDDSEAMSDEPGQSVEYKSPEGYYSLLDFVTGKQKPKIRVYLAPRSVLMAIFKNDKPTVENIIQERERLFQQASHSDQLDQLSESFKNQFERLHDHDINDETLNFTVSKTNPKYYR